MTDRTPARADGPVPKAVGARRLGPESTHRLNRRFLLGGMTALAGSWAAARTRGPLVDHTRAGAVPNPYLDATPVPVEGTPPVPPGIAIVRNQRPVYGGEPRRGGELRLTRPPAEVENFSPAAFL